MIARYLEHSAQRNLRPTYLLNLRHTLERAELELGVPLEQATEEELTDWYAALSVDVGSRRGVPVAPRGLLPVPRPGTAPRRRSHPRLARPRLRRHLPRPIADDRLEHALAVAPKPVRTYLVLAAYAGLRAAEVAALHRDDLMEHAAPPVLVVRDGAKGSKHRVVPLHPHVLHALAQIPERGYLFPHESGRGHVAPNTISKRANAFLHGVGIPDSFHALRHWFGTTLYRESRDLRLCQELLGHSDPKTTAGYAAFAPDRAAGIVAALPDLGEPPGEVRRLRVVR